jgi:superfamily II DNA or RNA helicase
MDIVWRPYQNEILEADEKADKKKIKRRLIVSATGTGKRLIAVGLSKKYKRILFLCHTDELINQAYKDFNKMYPGQVGVIKGSRFEINNRIVIASAQTIWRRLDKIPKNFFDCVMADEVHHYLARTFVMPLKELIYKVSYGFTATPTRLDGLDFSNIMDDIIYNYPLERGIREGFLCQLDAIRIRTKINISDVKRSRGDFAINELSNAVNNEKRNELIVDKYIKHGNGRQAVAFCVDIAHAKALRDTFKKKCPSLKVETINSEMDLNLRRKYIRDYSNKKIDILTNVNILTEGWDYNDVGVLLMARPTESLALYMQMIGRGTRIKSDVYKKKHKVSNCLILDFVDNVGIHKIVNTWTLDNTKSVKEKVFVTEENRDKLIALEIQNKSERIARIKRFYDTDELINLFELPQIRLARKSDHWYNLPPTEAQINYLIHLGIYDSNVDYTRGQASNLISEQPITLAQRKRLAGLGYKVLDENGFELPITLSAFSEIMNNKNSRNS